MQEIRSAKKVKENPSKKSSVGVGFGIEETSYRDKLVWERLWGLLRGGTNLKPTKPRLEAFKFL